MIIKLFSCLSIVLLFFPMMVPAVMIPSVAPSQDHASMSIASAGITQDDTSAPSTVLSIGKITLTIIVKEPARRVLILYEAEGWTSTEEVVVSLSAKGYDTEVYMNGVLVDHRVRNINVLEPVVLTSTKPAAAIAAIEKPPVFQASYTYEWWDTIRLVNGPSWQVKYPHPDRDYYQIATFYPWTGYGAKLYHIQIDSYASSALAAGGWAVLFGAIGAAMGAMRGGPWYAAVGAAVGGILGLLFGYYTQAVLLDEQNCIWWWWSKAYGDWLAANAWWIWWLSLIPGGANSITMYAFTLYGYLRIGSYTLYDAPYVGAGSP